MNSMQNKTPLLEIKNLTHTYTDGSSNQHAIANINLNIYKGEFISVLGPSGCGKSTLLSILAGFIKPSEGSALINGKEIIGPDKERGVVFQSNTLYPWLSVRDSVELGLKINGIDKQKRKEISQNLLSEVNLLDYADNYSYELSGGMKQRVAIASVLANNPEVILMDEPFGALDAITRRKMQALIRKLWHEKQSTVFLITHDIDEALSLGTRVLVMSSSPGTIEKIYDVDYTYKALQSSKHRAKPDERYISIKEEILDIIDR